MVGVGTRWVKCCKIYFLVRSYQLASVHWLDFPECWLAGTCCNLLRLLLPRLAALVGLAYWFELTGHTQPADLQVARRSLALLVLSSLQV